MVLSGTASTAKSRVRFALALGCAAALGVASAGAQQPARAGVYTAAQADAGRAVYQANCAACHLPDLKGSNEALPLAGGNFMSTWRSRSTSDLFNKILTSMPPGKTGSLGETEIVTLVAFILQSNGAPAGNQALSATSAVPIADVATGQAAAQPRSDDEGGAATASKRAGPSSRPYGYRRGEKLPSGDRRNAAAPRSGRLADGPRQLSGLEPQPADADQP